ncbi:Putative ribonuclease H protein At1g65750 [Linum grandiflorum]
MMVDIRWQPLLDGWSCLNTDGSVKVGMRNAASGAVIRNLMGEVLRDFSIIMGSCSITRAELCGVMYGVELAWKLGVRKL